MISFGLRGICCFMQAVGFPRVVVALAVGALLPSCATVTEIDAEQPTSKPAFSADESPEDSATTSVIDETKVEDGEPTREPTLYKGNDQSVQMPPIRPPVKLVGDAVMLNFEQAPLTEVVDAILGDTLALDYVVEHPINGEITLRTRSPIPRDQLLPILESLLRNNDVLLIRGPNDRFFVSGSSYMRSTVPRFDSAPSAGFTNLIVPLQYIGAEEMAEILKPVAREDSFVRIDPRRNLLVLAGTQIQLEGWLDIIATFDVDQLQGMSVGIFPLLNSTVDEVFEELESIISNPDDPEAAGISGVVRIMPVQRLNSILVVSPRAAYVDTVRDWVEKLDSVANPESEPTLHVYEVKNGNVAQLSSLLSAIYSGGGGNSTGATTKKPSVAPGL